MTREDEALLAECNVETFRSTGPGGQNVNRRETAVRLTHRPTGIVVVSREERTQYRNKVIALGKLRAAIKRRYQRRTPRVKTNAPRRVREKILDTKRRQGEKKRLRQKPEPD